VQSGSHSTDCTVKLESRTQHLFPGAHADPPVQRTRAVLSPPLQRETSVSQLFGASRRTQQKPGGLHGSCSHSIEPLGLYRPASPPASAIAASGVLSSPFFVPKSEHALGAHTTNASSPRHRILRQ
jgi:hypothetical protein